MTPAAEQPDDPGEITPDATSARQPMTPRRQYLRYSGFKYDTFAQPDAEQEYGFANRDTLQVPPLTDQALAPQPDDYPSVLPRAYYVDPLYSERREGSVFEELRAPDHALVYGEPGAGKTTLRLAVETYARAFPNGTLVVTYEPGRAVESEVDRAVAAAGQGTAADADAAATDAHLRLLAAALAVDLFIQIIEQFGLRRDLPTARQNDALCTLITTIEPRLKAVLQRLMRGDDPTELYGFAWLWRRLDRPVVRPVVRTPQMRDWFKALRQHGQSPGEALPDGAAMWQRALDTARLWDFGRVFVMLDGLDTYWRRPPDMLRLLDPLLRLLPRFAAQEVNLKAFLPRELETSVAQRLEAYGVAADEVRVIVLAWTDERLRALVLTRYRAARSRRLTLSDLVDKEDKEFHERIDDMLIESARGNPRRLLFILHELVEVHIADPDGPVERPITRAEWATAVERAEARMAG